MRVGAKTDRGLVRQRNEDAYGYRERLWVVADGMGGHQAGEIASAIAVETILARVADQTEIGIEQSLIAAVMAANSAILERTEADPEVQGMGTTVALLFLGKSQAYLVNLGDSRIYQLTQGQLFQLTKDDSLVAEMVRNGDLTAAEAEEHPHRNVLTKALGTKQQLELEVQRVPWQAGDKFLLCSDGLSGVVSEAQLRQELAAAVEPQTIADQLVTAANSNGGNDNITVIVVEV